MNAKENRRILVVDDTPSIHADFKKIFLSEEIDGTSIDRVAASLFDEPESPSEQKPDFEVDSAYQGEEGLEMIRRAVAEDRPYLMAFVDIRMPPGWDGLETITRIWKEFPGLQIVICTAYSDYSWGDLVSRLGSSDRLFILKKPFDIVQIQQLAAMTWERCQTEAELANYREHLEKLVEERTSQLLEINADLERANSQLEKEIGERFRAEEALRESEQMFRAITEYAGDITLIRDRNERYQYVSPSVFKVLGYRSTELVGSSLTDVLHPEDARLLRKVNERAFQNPYRTFRVAALRARHKDGHYVWLEGTLVGMPDVEGVDGVVCNYRDITERRETEISLKHSEERYRSLLESSTDLIWETDLDGVFTFASTRSEDILGFAPEELIGKTPLDLIAPVDRERAAKALWEMLSTEKRVTEFEGICIHKDGSDVIVSITAVPIVDFDEGTIGYRGLCRDVTEQRHANKALRESERKYRLLAENVNDVIWTSDLSLNWTYVSPSIEQLRGFAPEETLEQSLDEVLAPESVQYVKKLLAETLIDAAETPEILRDPITLEAEFTRKDKSTVWAEVKVTFLLKEDGSPSGIIGVIRDISDRRPGKPAPETEHLAASAS